MTRLYLFICLILYCSLIKSTLEQDQLVFKSLVSKKPVDPDVIIQLIYANNFQNDNQNNDNNPLVDTPLDRLSIVSNLKNLNHFNGVLDNILIPR